MTDQNPNPDPSEGEDPLADAERIVNDAAANFGDIEADEAGADEALNQAEQKAAEHLADLQRLQAEYVNYRKRVDRDREANNELATIKVIESLMPVLDDIAGARTAGELEDGPFAAISNKLEETLGRYGWESFGAVGEQFDPQVHDALMSQVSNEVEHPTIHEVVQAGHRVGERVIRAARVIVSQPE